MTVLDIIYARGHENILCDHKTTLEITKDNHLSKKGNCILAIMASKACYDLNDKLKSQIWSGKIINVILETGSFKDSFYGYGSEELPLLNHSDMVFRKSDFICERTVLINCNKASNQINKNIINSLTNPQTKLKITFKSTK
jgi:uncharacterized protein